MRYPEAGGQHAFEKPILMEKPRRRSHDTIVLWVFRDYDHVWIVRAEGNDEETTFVTRSDALAFARRLGNERGAYRLFFPLNDGRVARELFNVDAG